VRQPSPAHPRIALGVLLIVFVSVIAYTLAPIGGQEREILLARGKALFLEKGCHGCHRIGNMGTPIGPDLSRVGLGYREGDLGRWLGSPAEEPTPGQRMPELEPAEHDVSHLLRHMPTPRLNEAEAEALAAYLASLK
jgi:mono/diheme cytochrome c family protein